MLKLIRAKENRGDETGKAGALIPLLLHVSGVGKAIAGARFEGGGIRPRAGTGALFIYPAAGDAAAFVSVARLSAKNTTNDTV